jgi:uncharacterized protein YaaR (DUF327 family)
MDKIDALGESFSYKSLQKKTRKKESQKVGRFSSLIKSITAKNGAGVSFDEAEERVERLEELMDEITELGDVLVNTPTLDNVKRYRERVKQFLKYIVDHVLDVQEKISGANIRKRKKYMLINMVDKKLEDLSKEFLNRQSPQIDILSRIDEINGLLIDLLR